MSDFGKYSYDLPDDLPTHSRDEQHALIALARLGNHQAAAELVDGVMKLVVVTAQSIAAEHDLPSELFADAVHEGVIGCYVAIDKFNLARNLKFWTYAIWRVMARVRRYCATDYRLCYSEAACAAHRDNAQDPCRRAGADLDRSVVLHRLETAMAVLDRATTRMIRMKYFHGMTNVAIAERLQVRPGFVSARIIQALKRLQEEMER